MAVNFELDAHVDAVLKHFDSGFEAALDRNDLLSDALDALPDMPEDQFLALCERVSRALRW